MRSGLGCDAATAEARREAAREVLAARASGPKPSLPESFSDLVALFRAKSETLAASIDTVPGYEQVPAAVARYLQREKLPSQAVCWEKFSMFDWSGAGLDVAARPACGNDLIGITGVFCAIAETGTLMLLSGPAHGASTSLLPETHIALVPVVKLVPSMEEAFTRLRGEYGEMPRAVNFISGPSRTADIEQTLVLGAHGPYRVHVILVEAA